MANIIESVIISAQESENIVNQAADYLEIVKKKLLKMWNIMNSMGNPTHRTGPFTNQKRNFSLNVETVPIVPGKTFSNPNFVNSHHPSVHNDINYLSMSIEKVNHNDNLNVSSSPGTNSALINSSQSLMDTLKEHNLDTVKSSDPMPRVKTQPLKMWKNRNRRNRKNRRKKASGKNSKQNKTKNYIRDTMDIEVDVDPFIISEISVSPKISKTTFNLTDFVIESPKEVSTDDNAESDSDSDDFMATIISVSPSSISKICLRERKVSVSSEDSFIVFTAGTDEEDESSEDSESETEEEWEEQKCDNGEDEVDFSSSVIPSKKVRFAEDDNLCTVHPMVQWSFAYQQARKGPWEEYARDRDRFKRRVADTEQLLIPIFNDTHRKKVYRERFQDDISA